MMIQMPQDGGYANVRRDPISEIQRDMRLPGEGIPHGVPVNKDYRLHGRIAWGADPHGATAMRAWGQVFSDQGGDVAPNTRVEIKNLRLYVLSSKTGQWQLIQQSQAVQGLYCAEDFSNCTPDRDFRFEADGGDSTPMRVGMTFHFGARSDRAPINASDVRGVFSAFDARLVPNSRTAPSDVTQAHYLADGGADYWSSATASSAHAANNKDAGMGRFKYVTPEYRTFYMSTVPAQALRSNPPPGL